MLLSVCYPTLVADICRRETPVGAISEQVRAVVEELGPIWCHNCPRGSRKAERGGRRERSLHSASITPRTRAAAKKQSPTTFPRFGVGL